MPSQLQLPEARELIDMDRYFVIHGPRRSGKTTTLQSLQRELTEEGAAVAVPISCQPAAADGEFDQAGGGGLRAAALRADGGLWP